MKNTTVELSPIRDSRKSFYDKARVEIQGNTKRLISYSTEVAFITGGQAHILGQWSQTTTQHIKEFLYQEGFKADSTKQIMKDYGPKVKE